MKKALSLILALMLLAAAFAGCAGGTGGEDTATGVPTAQVSDTEAGTSDLYDSNGYLKDSIPEGKFNYNDEEFNVLYWSDREHEEFVAEAMTGDAVNDAIFTRNLNTETRMGVKLVFTGTPGNASNNANFTAKVDAAIQSGMHEYDMIGVYSITAGNLAVKGFLSELGGHDYPDLDKPWWPASLINDATIHGKLFFASGDISANVIYMMYVTFFNKQMIDNRNLESPYDLVKNGKWTIDKMFEMCQGIYEDTDNSGTPTLGDTYGQYAYTLHLDPFLIGSGITCIDASGDELAINEEFYGEKAGDIAKKISDFFHSNDKAYLITVNDKVHQYFGSDRSLFWNDRCRNSATFKNNEISFGVVPNPMFNEDQDAFYTCIGNPFSIYCIPSDAPDVDMSTAVMECYASETYRNVSPALYEITLKYRYTDDATSSEMFDIIRSSVVFDLGRIFSSNLGNPYTMFENSVKEGSNWSTVAASNAKRVWPANLKDINGAFE